MGTIDAELEPEEYLFDSGDDLTDHRVTPVRGICSLKNVPGTKLELNETIPDVWAARKLVLPMVSNSGHPDLHRTEKRPVYSDNKENSVNPIQGGLNGGCHRVKYTANSNASFTSYLDKLG